MKIFLKKSNRELIFDPEKDYGKTILDICKDNSVNTKYGCHNGYCQACKCQLLEGNVKYYSPAGQNLKDNEVLCCSCYPVTNISLDC